MSDPYAPSSSRIFDVVKPTGGGILFIAQDNGDVLNPFNVSRDIATDAAFSQGSFYAKTRQTMFDELKKMAKAKLEGQRQKREKEALDAEVQRILSQEPFKTQREDMEADRILFDNAMKDIDNTLHSYWEIKGFKELGIPEPSKGCRDCEGSWDSWFNRPRRNVLIVDPVAEAQDKLDNAFKDYMEKISIPPTTSALTRGGSGTVEEEAPP